MKNFVTKVKKYVNGRMMALSLVVGAIAATFVPSVCAEGEVTASDMTAVTGIMTTTATNMKSEILAVAPIALGVGATILIIMVVWRFFKKSAK